MKLSKRLYKAGVRLVVLSACNSGYWQIVNHSWWRDPAVIGVNGVIASQSTIEFCKKIIWITRGWIITRRSSVPCKIGSVEMDAETISSTGIVHDLHAIIRRVLFQDPAKKQHRPRWNETVHEKQPMKQYSMQKILMAWNTARSCRIHPSGAF